MKTLWSGIGMVAGSGKVQGTVMGKGRSGSFARVRVKPVNPRTNKQIGQQSKFATRSTAWRELDADEIAGWNAAADSGEWNLKNTLGISFRPTGAQLFNQLNLNLTKIGAANITAVPAKVAMPEIIMTGMEFETSEPIISVGFNTDIPDGTSMAIYMTGNLSPGISRPSESDFRFIKAVNWLGSTNVSAEYVAIFGDPILGQKAFAYAEAISETTGQMAQAGKQSIIAYTA